MVKKIILTAFIIFLLLPIWMMIVGSLQDIVGIMKMPPDIFPTHPTMQNYRDILKNANIIWLVNTLIVMAITICTSVLISCSAGYAFAHFQFPFKKLIWILLLMQIMVPVMTLYIPRYVIIKKLFISGTLLGATLPCVLSPMGIYLSRIYFETVPDSLIESAKIDGAGELLILKSIIIPVSKPIITAISLFAGIGALGNYVWQMLVLQREERQTMLIGFTRIITNYSDPMQRLNPIGRNLAVGCLLLLPVIIIFSIFSRYFTESLSGAIKE